MIGAVLFDMDGLMFDTERIGHAGWLAAGEQLGIQIPEDIISAMRGTGREECRRLFNGRIPGNRYDAAKALRDTYADRYIRQHGVPVKPGLGELLEWLRGKNIPAALATSTARERAVAYLKEAGVDGYFSAMVFGPEVSRAKPAPDIFLAAASALDKAPEHCVVLEDSPNGLRAAKAAGCTAIVIPDLTPAPEKRENLWDAKADSLLDVLPILKRIHTEGA